MRILKLNKEIYNGNHLQNAAKAYEALAEIRVEAQPSYWVVSFQKCQYDENQTVSEFENYLIDRMNSLR